MQYLYYKSIVFFLILSLQNSLCIVINITIDSTGFYKLPRFWTNTGFCPWGDVKNSTEISNSLLSNDTRMNIELIGSLPNQGLSTIRIHWLLQLIDFIKFDKNGIKPKYNFKKLDKFLKWIKKAKLVVGFEFMGNPGNVFSYKNVSKEFLWKDLSYKIVTRYLKRFGVETVSKWKFESWNEPDLKNYNLLKFNQEDYLAYILSLRDGLNAATNRTVNNTTHLKLCGPAGLFKELDKHPLCWSTVEYCNTNSCPFDILTFHRKGQGLADDVFAGTKKLIDDLLAKYPQLRPVKFSNNEADPIAGWSTPRPFQSGLSYAVDVVKIICQHWSAMINYPEFNSLESISHDNAFLSYWPHVFDQRTLLARFQMNNSHPPYSQFVKKPVYAGLGMLGNLGEYARDIRILKHSNINILTTTENPNSTSYVAILFFTDNLSWKSSVFTIKLALKNLIPHKDKIAYIVEGIVNTITDPVTVWDYHDRPSYPNPTIRSAMRSVQGPMVLKQNDELHLKVTNKDLHITFHAPLKSPWVILLRVCTHKIHPPFKPYNLRIRNVTNGEVMILWNEIYRNERCLMTYEICFSKNIESNWEVITSGIHVPFLSYHFQPEDGITQGYYKVRGLDVFGRAGKFSKVKSFF